MMIPGNLPALIFGLSFTCGFPGRFLFHRLGHLVCGWESSPAAPNFSDTSEQPSRDESPGRRGNRALPTARQTARQPRHAAARVALPTNGLPDIRIGVCCRCNRPDNRGNTRSRPAPLLCSPRTPVGAVHTLSLDAACPRGRRILSALPRAQHLTGVRFLSISFSS